MRTILTKAGCYLFFACAMVAGGYVGSALQSKSYPVQMIERALITPDVRPGDAILLAQHVNRIDQCDIVVKRVISTATGQRFNIKQEFEDGFGPLGGDKYILPVKTPDTANYGPAQMYSKAYSYCSWLDYLIRPSEAESWTMTFTFAQDTSFTAVPKSFEHIGVKTSKAPAPTAPTPELHPGTP